MTRLPVDTWNVQPCHDLPPYDLNEVCPVTGESAELEDHHIFRRSFTAQGKEGNQNLWWVRYVDEETGVVWVVRNRIALSPEAHARITTNRAKLEYRGDDLWYIEGDQELNLNLRFRLLSREEKISKPRRKKASTAEERKARVNYCIRTPKDEENVIPELQDMIRELLDLVDIGISSTVSAYHIHVRALVLLMDELRLQAEALGTWKRPS